MWQKLYWEGRTIYTGKVWYTLPIRFDSAIITFIQDCLEAGKHCRCALRCLDRLGQGKAEQIWLSLSSKYEACCLLLPLFSASKFATTNTCPPLLLLPRAPTSSNQPPPQPLNLSTLPSDDLVVSRPLPNLLLALAIQIKFFFTCAPTQLMCSIFPHFCFTNPYPCLLVTTFLC